jgi:hypothetical protein
MKSTIMEVEGRERAFSGGDEIGVLLYKYTNTPNVVRHKTSTVLSTPTTTTWSWVTPANFPRSSAGLVAFDKASV